MYMGKTALVWFRNDLRIADNNSLYSAVSQNEKVLAVFCFDPRLFEVGAFGFKKTEKFRAKFLIESIQELKKNLGFLNISLLVYSAKPETVIPKVIADFKVDTVYFQEEWTQEEVRVLKSTQSAVFNTDVEWVKSYDQFLFHPDDIPFSTEEIPRVFTNFRKKCERLAAVRSEVSVQPK